MKNTKLFFQINRNPPINYFLENKKDESPLSHVQTEFIPGSPDFPNNYLK